MNQKKKKKDCEIRLEKCQAYQDLSLLYAWPAHVARCQSVGHYKQRPQVYVFVEIDIFHPACMCVPFPFFNLYLANPIEESI